MPPTPGAAASPDTTQGCSRLEHSLGVLALVAHFGVDDPVVRAAALLHDVGHLPFSHTFEGVAGLDHHRLGVERIGQVEEVLSAHGVDAASVVDAVSGAGPSALHGGTGALRLDHLDSLPAQRPGARQDA